MTKIIGWIIGIAIFAMLFVLALNNLDTVTLHFAGEMQWDAPLIVLILIVFAIGCLVGMLAMLPFVWRRRIKARKAAKATREANKILAPSVN